MFVHVYIGNQEISTQGAGAIPKSNHLSDAIIGLSHTKSWHSQASLISIYDSANLMIEFQMD
jgi:hypothetical protein